MRMTRTWDSTMSMIPKGGDTIWGGLDWSPEEGYVCMKKQKHNESHVHRDINADKLISHSNNANYGRMISFGKEVATMPSSKIERIDFRVNYSCHQAHDAVFIYISLFPFPLLSGCINNAILFFMLSGGLLCDGLVYDIHQYLSQSCVQY